MQQEIQKQLKQFQASQEMDRRGVDLGSKLAVRLGEPWAKYLPPEALIGVGTAAYTPEEFQRGVPASLGIQLSFKGVPRDEISRLLGTPNSAGNYFFEGSLLKAKLQNLTGSDRTDIAHDFGQLLACHFFVNGDHGLKRGLRYKTKDDKTSTITDYSESTVDIPKPDFTVEIGPGIAGFSKFVPGQEIEATARAVLIDPNSLVAAFLKKANTLFADLRQQGSGKRVDIMEELMSTGLLKLVQLRNSGTVDLIVASGVHSAGNHEWEKSILLIYDLLRDGGFFAIQAPIEVDSGESEAQWIHELTQGAFQNQPIKLDTYVTTSQGTAISAVFQK